MPRRTQTLSDEAIGVAIEAVESSIEARMNIPRGEDESAVALLAPLFRALDELDAMRNGNAVKVGEKKGEKRERAPRGRGRKRGLPNTEDETAAEVEA